MKSIWMCSTNKATLQAIKETIRIILLCTLVMPVAAQATAMTLVHNVDSYAIDIGCSRTLHWYISCRGSVMQKMIRWS